VRVVVCIGLEDRDPFMLAPARLQDPPWIAGGVRTMHELAVAAAAAGYETEVRGDFHGDVLAQMATAAGVTVGTPSEPRVAQPDDLLCVPDGIRDPAFFVRVALMPSTPVYLALAPPGLFGWSFMPDWRFVEALAVDPAAVGRPEHCQAIDGMGFHVWSNAITTGGAFAAAGVPATVLHMGWPTSMPTEPEKDVDVVTIGENRWSTITRRSLEGFSGSWRELPMMPNAQLVEELGRGRVFVHCARIEGHSRLAIEARLMGTVCVGLASNRFAVGFDEAAGGVMVERIDDIAAAVERILADPRELARRQERARAEARSISGWEPYVDRVSAAIAAIAAGPHPAGRFAPGRSPSLR
jgi:glycosyltransferase involved in cell wall biosynthesis